MGQSRDTVNTGSPKRKQPKHDTTPTNTSHDNHPDNSHCETYDKTNQGNCKKGSTSDGKHDQGSQL